MNERPRALASRCFSVPQRSASLMVLFPLGLFAAGEVAGQCSNAKGKIGQRSTRGQHTASARSARGQQARGQHHVTRLLQNRPASGMILSMMRRRWSSVPARRAAWMHLAP